MRVEMCGKKERRVGTKERELKSGHAISILVVVLIMVNVSFSLCWIWMVKFRSYPGESEHRLKASCLRLQAGRSKTRTNFFALKKIQ